MGTGTSVAALFDPTELRPHRTLDPVGVYSTLTAHFSITLNLQLAHSCFWVP